MDPDPYLVPDWIRIKLGPWIRILIQDGKMTLKHRKKSINLK